MLKLMTVCLFLVIIFFNTQLFSKENCAIKGVVRDIHTEKPLADVILHIQKTDLKVFSNPSGDFCFPDVPVGEYILEAIKPGYTKYLQTVKVSFPGMNDTIRLFLVPSQKMSEDIFFIGGIEIVAKSGSEINELGSVTSIQSGQIEHIQAASLGDVLEMLPGTEMNNQANLKEPIRGILRDPRSDAAAFALGTQVVMDDIPISNNSNMQTSATLAGIETSAQNGLDLREIPADNIESVAIYSGIAPAQFGDFVGGVIDIKTRREKKSYNRLKFKNNPDTREMTLLGAIMPGNTNIDYTLGWAYSERDLRWENDGYHRFNIQIKTTNFVKNKSIEIRNNIKFFRTLDEVKIDPADSAAIASYNRGYRLLLGQKASFELSGWGRFSNQLYLNYRHINSFKQQRKITALTPISDLIISGTREAIIPDNHYIYKVTTTGDEFSIGHKFNWQRKFFTGNIFHRFITGEDFSYENNYGDGRQFDILKPAVFGDRPYSFNDVPGMTTFSVYFNDRITGKFGKEFTIDLGLRYELYNPRAISGMNLFSSRPFLKHHNGSFLNPRINGVLYLSDHSRVNLGYGASSKSPSIHSIYPQPYYLDVLDILPVQITTDSVYYDRNRIISTYVYNPQNPDLNGFQEHKYEAGLFQLVRNWNFQLTGYLTFQKNIPTPKEMPFIYHRFIRPNWPNSGGEKVDTSFLGTYDLLVNGAWHRFSGIELSVESDLIESINCRFKVDAAYQFVRSGIDFPEMGYIVQSKLAVPYYRNSEQWTDKLVVTYHSTYISKRLGIWLTLTAQQVPLHREKLYGEDEIYAIGYWDGQKNEYVPIPEDQQRNSEFNIFKRSRDQFSFVLEDRPNKWIFNFKVSKALYHGAEVSFFVNNFMDNRAIYRIKRSSTASYQQRNPPIFYGMEFSMLF